MRRRRRTLFEEGQGAVWPFGMDREELLAFLRENWDLFVGILLSTYGMTVDEIVIGHMGEEASAYLDRL